MSTSAQVLPSRLLILLLALASVFLLFSSRVEAGQPEEVRRHVVVAGDTLWELAEEATDPGEDVRATVARLKRLNGLNDSGLVPGQELLLPA